MPLKSHARSVAAALVAAMAVVWGTIGFTSTQHARTERTEIAALAVGAAAGPDALQSVSVATLSDEADLASDASHWMPAGFVAKAPGSLKGSHLDASQTTTDAVDLAQHRASQRGPPAL